VEALERQLAGGLDRMVVVGTADDGKLGARMTLIAGQ